MFLINCCRTTESESDKLIQWASLGYQKTTNLQIKPYLIMIINKDTRKGNNNWWDVEYATETQISKMGMPERFKRLQQAWMDRGKLIHTVKDLINCYYDGFRVICIPSLGAYSAALVTEQHEKLHQEIQRASKRVAWKQERSGIMLDMESYILYTQQAFKYLSRSRDDPFDARGVGEDTGAILDLVDHITNLLVRVKESLPPSPGTNTVVETAVFGIATPYLASCLALELEKRRG